MGPGLSFQFFLHGAFRSQPTRGQLFTSHSSYPSLLPLPLRTHTSEQSPSRLKRTQTLQSPFLHLRGRFASVKFPVGERATLLISEERKLRQGTGVFRNDQRIKGVPKPPFCTTTPRPRGPGQTSVPTHSHGPGAPPFPVPSPGPGRGRPVSQLLPALTQRDRGGEAGCGVHRLVG